jgi:excisionase family DNA binding protein
MTDIPNLVLLGRTAPLRPAPLTRDHLLTAEQLSDRWQVPKSHVYRLAREGHIPTVRLGRYRRFRLDEIERHERSAGRSAQGGVR